MNLVASHFHLAPFTAEDVLDTLRPHLRVEEEEPVDCTRRYLESFDWRLYNAGTALYLETRDGRSQLRWERRDSEAAEHTLSCRKLPRMPDDLPPGPFRSALAEALKLRALLPLVTVRFRQQALRVLNADDKTVVRVQIEAAESVEAPDGTTTPMAGVTIRLIPVRGYDRQLSRLHDRLAELPGVFDANRSLLDRALDVVGRTPGDTGAKFDLAPLDPHMRADEAIKAVCRALMRTMRQNEPGVREDLDTEFLHDYRVALRRTRSVLGEFKKVFPAEDMVRYRGELRTLFQATGLTRDMDVYVLSFEEYQSWLPAATRTDLVPLRVFLEERQRKAHRRMVKTFDTPWYATLMDDWQAFIEAPMREEPATPEAAMPIFELAALRTWKAYLHVLNAGNAILAQVDVPAEALHDLRKDCKKLRYLMELFRSLYPPQVIDRLIRVLKRLQDTLGNFQDYQVQQENLDRFALDMQEAGRVETRTFLAMGRLEGHLEGLETATRAEFNEVFEEFAQPKNQHRFAALFRI